MTKHFLSFSFGLLFLLSCNPSEKKTESKKDVSVSEKLKEVNAYLKRFEEPSQKFSVGHRKNSKIIGLRGTIIYVNPADLETEAGENAEDSIQLELKELSTVEQFVRSNTATVSNGKLLISGGAYFINMASNGKQLKLKQGKTLKVQFPKLTEEEMSLFYAERDSNEVTNWQEAKTDFAFQTGARPKKTDTNQYEITIVSGKGDTSIINSQELTEEQLKKYESEKRISDRVYAPIELNRFGWINCDRFYNEDGPKANISLEITNINSTANLIKIYAVFKRVRSMNSSIYYVYDGKTEKDDFRNIPIGEQIEFLAVGTKDGKLFCTAQTVTVQQNQHLKLTLEETTEKEFDALLSEI